MNYSSVHRSRDEPTNGEAMAHVEEGLIVESPPSQNNFKMGPLVSSSLITTEHEPTIHEGVEEGLQQQQQQGTRDRSVASGDTDTDLPSSSVYSDDKSGATTRRRKKKKLKLSTKLPELSTATAAAAMKVSIEATQFSTRTASVAAKAVAEEAYEVVEVVHQWASIASIHGVPFMVDKHFKLWRKLFWAILVLGSTVLMVIQVNDLVADYRAYRLVTSTFVESPANLTFPEIVLCNLISLVPSEMNRTGIESPKNAEELIAMSYPVEFFILDASFGGKQLEPISEHFTPLITERGVCFRFHTTEVVSVPGALPGAGRHSRGTTGLFVALWLSPTQDSAMVYAASENKTEVTQMPVVIANRDKYNIVGLSRTRIDREIKKPWSKCNASAPKEYSRESCRSDCWMEASRLYRNCTVWGDESDEAMDMDYCPIAQQQGNGTVNEPMEKFADDCERENCVVPPCREEFFPMKSSVMQYDNPFEDLGEVDSTLTLSFVSINYETMRVESISETRASTLPQLLASIGGAMGLFLGISTLSLVELIGELVALRLLPRLWGDKRLYGLGSKEQ